MPLYDDPVYVSTSFVYFCPWGCPIQVVDGKAQPHTCRGPSILVDLFMAGALDQDQTYGQIADRLAKALEPHLRELAAEAWQRGREYEKEQQ